jgi:intracellular septation protein A
MLTATGTYVYDSPTLLIVKDTVYYALFAILLVTGIYTGRRLFQTFFGHIFAITDRGWQLLEQRWLIFFFLAALSNELVRVFLTTDGWVIYKQVVVLVFLGFGLYQFKVSSTHRLPEADRLGLRKLSPALAVDVQEKTRT